MSQGSGSDEDLMARYYQGDEDAFARLAKNLFNRLFCFFRRFVPEHDAEDLAQETLLRVARTRGRTQTEYDQTKSRFITWLFTIARNCGLEYMRRKRRRKSLEADSEEAIDEAQDKSFTPYEQLDHRMEFSERVSVALDKLTQEQREVLLLDLQGLDAQEIAGILGVPKTTVYTRRFAGLERMRELLDRS
jgi:RNA polymerase sigma-70 factor (ECF subfamily)